VGFFLCLGPLSGENCPFHYSNTDGWQLTLLIASQAAHSHCSHRCSSHNVVCKPSSTSPCCCSQLVLKHNVGRMNHVLQAVPDILVKNGFSSYFITAPSDLGALSTALQDQSFTPLDPHWNMHLNLSLRCSCKPKKGFRTTKSFYAGVRAGQCSGALHHRPAAEPFHLLHSRSGPDCAGRGESREPPL
jgi:hypothetical protein